MVIDRREAIEAALAADAPSDSVTVLDDVVAAHRAGSRAQFELFAAEVFSKF